MKKEKIKNLFQEMIDRDFHIDEIAEIFSLMHDYISAKRESERKEEDKDYRSFHASCVPRYRVWLQKTLEKYGIDCTIEEVDEPF